ncbi:MAG: response regulator [Pseudomonadota bacterium]
MSIIAITSGLFTNAGSAVSRLSATLNHAVVTDNDIIEETIRVQGVNRSTIDKVIKCSPIAYNDFTHEKEKHIACLRKTVADHVTRGDTIFHGILGHLIPKWTTHVLSVLIITDKATRIQTGAARLGKTEQDVTARINEADRQAIFWINSITGKKAWDKTLYDIVIPSDKVSPEETMELITRHLNSMPDITPEKIRREAQDLALAARVDLALAEMGSNLAVSANNGHIVITIDRNVLLLSKFQQKVTLIAQQVEGVRSVETKIGKNYYNCDTNQNLELSDPFHILLVDDEKEFVQTLSERLKMRQIANNVAFNGQDAIDIANSNDTEVMVLDLKMPGVDGFEVLRKIKSTKPYIEVIILTGHGSDKDRAACMELGAFAYLQKPADIDLLTQTMKEAYARINRKKTLLQQPRQDR